MNYWSLIFSNLKRLSRSMLIIWIWIVFSTVSTVLVSTASKGSEENANDLIKNTAGINQITILRGNGYIQNQNPINDNAIADLRTIEGVQAVVSIDMISASMEFGPYINYPSVIGVGTDNLDVFNYKLTAGILKLGRGRAIIGSNIAQKFVLKNRMSKEKIYPDDELLGKTIKLVIPRYNSSDGTVSNQSYPFVVSGILAATGGMSDYSVYVRESEGEKLKKWATGKQINRRMDGYDNLIVFTDSVDNVKPVFDTITEKKFQAESNLVSALAMQKISDSLKSASIVITIVSLISSVFGIFLSSANSISERKEEIGLMKALGTTKGKILKIFFSESLLIGLTGSILGLFVQYGIQKYVLYLVQTGAILEGQIKIFGLDIRNISFVNKPDFYILVIIAVSLFSLIGSLLPAYRAANLDPIVALRDL